jgi:hypothetical protein
MFRLFRRKMIFSDQIRPDARNTVAGIWADRIPAKMAGFRRQ